MPKSRSLPAASGRFAHLAKVSAEDFAEAQAVCRRVVAAHASAPKAEAEEAASQVLEALRRAPGASN